MSRKHRKKPLRIWIMTFMVMFLIPAFFIGLLEVGLRLAGYGFPTSFFIEKEEEGETYLYPNQAFTFQFFPKALARSTAPMRIAADKAEDTYRIFIFGESAALGDPDPAYGFGRHLEILLEDRYPGIDFEIINTAITAINSHVILPIARDCAKRDGDLWIIYMGNNEVIGPYGAGTIFGSKAPPLALVRTSLALRRTRIGQLIKNLSENARTEASSPETWGGISMFTENLLRPDDPARLRVYDTFEQNLEDILKAGTEAGVPVLLSTVASNLKDCAPFASLHGESLSDAQQNQWNILFDQGKALEKEGAYTEALLRYEAAATIDAEHAELQFRIARGHGLSGSMNVSRERLEQARDLDGLVVRTDSIQNRIIEEAANASKEDSIHLVDAAGLLQADSPGGIPGKELFFEHVHFTLQGNYLLARSFAERIREQLPREIIERETSEWTGPGTCQRKLATTLWDKNRLWTEVFERQTRPPFSSRAHNDTNLAYSKSMADQFASRINPRFDRLIYEKAIEADPNDYLLRNKFGNYLMLNKAIPEAITQYEWIAKKFPGFAGGHQDLGLAYFLNGQYDLARSSFNRVLELNPDYDKARQALALIDKQAP